MYTKPAVLNGSPSHSSMPMLMLSHVTVAESPSACCSSADPWAPLFTNATFCCERVITASHSARCSR
jgi:hypothetical protein